MDELTRFESEGLIERELAHIELKCFREAVAQLDLSLCFVGTWQSLTCQTHSRLGVTIMISNMSWFTRLATCDAINYCLQNREFTRLVGISRS